MGESKIENKITEFHKTNNNENKNLRIYRIQLSSYKTVSAALNKSEDRNIDEYPTQKAKTAARLIQRK